MWRARLKALHTSRRELLHLGVTPTEAGVLLYLQRHPGSYLRRVADAFALDASWTGTVIRALQQHGWVTKQRAPGDDSYVLLRMTRKGTALVGKIMHLGEPSEPSPATRHHARGSVVQ
jgi:DNA-binding MarR family transcriptional regulator